MIHTVLLAAAGAVALAGTPSASAAPPAGDPAAPRLAVAVAADTAGPAAPRMGDRLTFHSTVANRGAEAAPAMVVWLTLLRLDAGHEQAVDLED